MFNVIDIERAVARADYVEALGRALVGWREQRSAEIGDLIDALTPRVECGAVRGWSEWRDRVAWVEIAMAEATAEICTLLAGVIGAEASVPEPALVAYHAERAREVPIALDAASSGFHYLLRLPPDPRIAERIVDWAEHTTIAFPRVVYYFNTNDDSSIRQALAMIAAGFARHVDVRLRGRLEILANRTPALTHAARLAQRTIAHAGLVALGAIPPETPWPPGLATTLGPRNVTSMVPLPTLAPHPARPPLAPAVRDRVVALVAACGGVPPRPRSLPPPPARSRFAPDELWQQISAAPDDDAPRQVLGDALIERDEPRGDIIIAQLVRRRAAIANIIRTHWAAWMGDELSRVLVRKRCRFERGMLHSICLGAGPTPSWVFAAATGHRELVAVRNVRIRRVHPPDYGAFVGALPNVTDVEIDSVEIGREVSACDAFPRLTRLAIRDLRDPAQIEPLLAAPALRGAAIALPYAQTIEPLLRVICDHPHIAFEVCPFREDAPPWPALPNLRRTRRFDWR